MPRDVNGNYSLPNGTLVNIGDIVLPSQHNPAMNDIATALTGSLARNGNGQMLADLNMGGFRILNQAGGPAPTVKDFGAIGDGVTDDTAAFTAAMVASRVVIVPPVATSYICAPMTAQQEGQALIGYGDKSCIQLKSGSTGVLFDQNGLGVTLQNLRFFGGDDSGKSSIPAPTSSRNGLLVDFNTLTRLIGVRVHGFASVGIGTGNSTANRACNCALVEVDSYNNWSNLELGPNAAEYVTLTNVRCNGGRYGMIISSGNVVGAGGHLGDNYVNLWLDGNGIGNDGHGTLTGYTFNHATAYSVYARGIKNGFNLNGNQFFYGNIWLQNSKGVSIRNSEVSIAGIQFEGGGINWFCDNNILIDSPGGQVCAVSHNYNGFADKSIAYGNYCTVDPVTPANVNKMYASDGIRVMGRSILASGDLPFLVFGENGSPDAEGVVWTGNQSTGYIRLWPWTAGLKGATSILDIDKTSGKIMNLRANFTAAADDAAAATAGVPIGGLYQASGVVRQRLT